MASSQLKGESRSTRADNLSPDVVKLEAKPAGDHAEPERPEKGVKKQAGTSDSRKDERFVTDWFID
jgi:hypothetical protein